jgi:hypothetical protein
MTKRIPMMAVKLNFFLAFIIFFQLNYGVFGQTVFGKIDAKMPISTVGAIKKKLNTKRSFDASFETKIVDICKVKGCWATVDFGGEDVDIRFWKDGFTLPAKELNKNIIFQGQVKKVILDIDTQKEIAREDGLSEIEISKITKPKVEYQLIAKGIKIK